LLTRNEILRLKSLHSPKGRKAENSVLIEGLRIVEDCIKSDWHILQFFIVESNVDKPLYQAVLNLARSLKIPPIEVSNKDMERISDTKNPQGIALEIKLPDKNDEIQLNEKIVYLDNISDPGNLGTLMRTAVWFGINQIILSENCASIWNSKVVRSAMGAHFKIDCHVCNLDKLITKKKIPHNIFGAFMSGESLESISLKKKNWILILGNEARGISSDIEQFINQKITINGSGQHESLNVAVAGGIILNYLSRGN
jgi:RNA methyltransferase, TrmH family